MARQRSIATYLLALLVAVGVSVPVAGRGDEKPAKSPNAQLSDDWEDIVLLEATRALQLSPTQLRQLLTVARMAETRLGKLAGEEKRIVTNLQSVAAQNRGALLAGRAGYPLQQSAGLAHWNNYLQNRAQLEDQALNELVPRLLKILTREQVQRAYLLTVGQLPVDTTEAPSPAVLDPGAGFVMTAEQHVQWRDSIVWSEIAARYPADVLSALAPRRSVLWTRPADSGPFTLEVVAVYPAFLDTQVGLNESALFQAAGEISQAETYWDSIGQRIPGDAPQPELEIAIRPLARRLFLSKRLRPVLEERFAPPATHSRSRK